MSSMLVQLVRVVPILLVMLTTGVAKSDESPAGIAVTGTHFYVSPQGTPEADGSESLPWNLQRALNHPKSIRPGDTIYLRGGTYKGSFISKLTGTSTQPITVRSYPGEWATIDIASLTKSASGSLRIAGPWSVFRDLEVTNSTTRRQYRMGSGVTGQRPPGVHNIDVLAANVKLINLVVHDATHAGIGLRAESQDAEVYGCLIYNNGISKWEHGIYAGGVSPNAKIIADNIIFNNASLGVTLHAGGKHFGYHIEGNAVFNNGLLYQNARNFDIGLGDRIERLALLDNFTYGTKAGFVDVSLNFSSIDKDITLRGNYFAGGMMHVEEGSSATITGNRFVAPSVIVTGKPSKAVAPGSYNWDYNQYFSREDPGRPFSFPFATRSKPMSFQEWRKATAFDTNSIYTSGRPGTVDVFMRPNRYEAGRANLIVYNWPNLDFVDVNVSTVLSRGARYQVINAQDPFAPPVLSGVYSGEALRLPLKDLTVAKPVDSTHPNPRSATDVEFGVFVLLSY